MQDIKHHEMVRRLVKPGAEILATLDLPKLVLLVAATSICRGLRNPPGRECPGLRQRGQGELHSPRRTGQWADLVHAAVGITTEAGELLDAIKKLVIYNKPLDRENVIEELGDLEFYCEQWNQNPGSPEVYALDILRAEMAVVCHAIGVTRQEVLDANIAKLRKRYEGLVYSDTAAQERADKQG